MQPLGILGGVYRAGLLSYAAEQTAYGTRLGTTCSWVEADRA